MPRLSSGRAAAWDDALAGAATATFFDGAHGVRQAAGTAIDLDAETAWLLCGAPSCAGQSPDAMTAARPWGSNNPRWTVYASGTAATLLGPGGRAGPGYVVVWVGDDAAENDAEPLLDGGAPVAEAGSLVNPGLDAIGLRARGVGPSRQPPGAGMGGGASRAGGPHRDSRPGLARAAGRAAVDCSSGGKQPKKEIDACIDVGPGRAVDGGVSAPSRWATWRARRPNGARPSRPPARPTRTTS